MHGMRGRRGIGLAGLVLAALALPAEAGRGEPEDGKTAYVLDLGRGADDVPLDLVLTLGPGIWEARGVRMFPEPYRQDEVLWLGYTNDPRSAGLHAYAALAIRDLRAPKKPGGAGPAHGGAPPETPPDPGQPGPTGEVDDRRIVEEHFQSLLETLRKDGWTVTVPLDGFQVPRKLKAAGRKIPLFIGDFVAVDPTWISSSTGKAEPHYYYVHAFVTNGYLVSMTVQDNQVKNMVSHFMDGLGLATHGTAPVAVRNYKSWLRNVDAEQRSAPVSARLPKEFERVLPGAPGRSADPFDEPEALATWVVRDATGVVRRRVVLLGAPLRLGFDREWAGWLRARSVRHRVSGKPSLQVIAEGVRGVVHTATTQDGTAVWRARLLALPVADRLLVVRVEALGDTDEAEKDAANDLRLLLPTLGVSLTEPFRVPSTSR